MKYSCGRRPKHFELRGAVAERVSWYMRMLRQGWIPLARLALAFWIASSSTSSFCRWPPSPAAGWSFVTDTDTQNGSAASALPWRFDEPWSDTQESAGSSAAPPFNWYADDDWAVCTAAAWTSFEASFAYRWPRPSDPPTKIGPDGHTFPGAIGNGVASMIIGARSAADLIVIDFPGGGQQVRANGFWVVVSRFGADGVRRTIYQVRISS